MTKCKIYSEFADNPLTREQLMDLIIDIGTVLDEQDVSPPHYILLPDDHPLMKVLEVSRWQRIKTRVKRLLRLIREPG